MAVERAPDGAASEVVKLRVAAVLLLIVLAGANYFLADWYRVEIPGLDRKVTSTTILLDALGEIRTFIAQTIWLETDVYHHEMEAQGIPWTAEVDIMPMYKMVTMLDPRFVDAYDVASYQLVMNFNRAKEGFAYLRDGIVNNPRSYLLRYDMAFLLFETGHYVQAVEPAENARTLALKNLAQADKDAAEGRLAPADVQRTLGQRAIDLLNTLRILAHAYRRMGVRDGEIHYLLQWLQVRPRDPYALPRLQALGVKPPPPPPHPLIPD